MWCPSKIVNLGWNLQDSSPVRIFGKPWGWNSPSIHVFISKDEYRTTLGIFQLFNIAQTNSTYVGHVEVLQFTYGDSAKKWKLTKEIPGNSKFSNLPQNCQKVSRIFAVPVELLKESSGSLGLRMHSILISLVETIVEKESNHICNSL